MIEAVSLANLKINGITAALNAGTVEFWSGAMPVSTLTTPAGVKLGTVTLQNPSFGSAVNGSALIVPTAVYNATVGGVLSFLRWVSSTSEVLLMMEVSISADLDAEVLVSTVNIALNDPLSLSGISFS